MYIEKIQNKRYRKLGKDYTRHLRILALPHTLAWFLNAHTSNLIPPPLADMLNQREASDQVPSEE